MTPGDSRRVPPAPASTFPCRSSSRPASAPVSVACLLTTRGHCVGPIVPSIVSSIVSSIVPPSQGNWASVSSIIDHWGDYGKVLQASAGPDGQYGGHWHDMGPCVCVCVCVCVFVCVACGPSAFFRLSTPLEAAILGARSRDPFTCDGDAVAALFNRRSAPLPGTAPNRSFPLICPQCTRILFVQTCFWSASTSSGACPASRSSRARPSSECGACWPQ